MKRLISILGLLLAQAALAGTIGLYNDSRSWTGQVYIAIIGDSITGGGGGGGVGISGLPNAISNASGGRLTVTNFSYGGSVWTNEVWMAQTTNNPVNPDAFMQITNAWPFHPRWVFAHFGRNDVWPYMNQAPDTNFLTEGYPAYWPHIQTMLYNTLTNCTAHGAKLLVGEVLPSDIANCCTDAQMEEGGIQTVTNYNRMYGLWCSTNTGAYVSIQHDAFGVWDSHTPGLNLLNTNYWLSTNDTLHLNQAAYDMWGPLLVSNLANFFPDRNATISTVKAGTARMAP